MDYDSRPEQTLDWLLIQVRWLTAAEVNAAQRFPPDDLEEPARLWLLSRRIFGVSNHRGRVLFARYQFDANMQPLPVIADLLGSFGDGSTDPWLIAAWFGYPNAWLVHRGPDGAMNVAPKDLLLERPDEVKLALRRRLDGYVA